MGLNREDDAPIEAQEEPIDGLVEESPDINECDDAVKEVDEEQLINDLYEEDILDIKIEEDPNMGQFSTLCFADVDDDINCDVHFGSMTFIDPTDDNYAIKLASAQRAEKLLPQEEIVAELVDDPVLKFKAEGQLTKKPGPKLKVTGAKVAPKVAPVFNMKFRIL